MTLLLRAVHYVLARGASAGACRTAHLASHQLEGADLDVELDWTRDAGAEGVAPELTLFPIAAELHDVPFDPAATRGSWHLADACPKGPGTTRTG